MRSRAEFKRLWNLDLERVGTKRLSAVSDISHGTKYNFLCSLWSNFSICEIWIISNTKPTRKMLERLSKDRVVDPEISRCLDVLLSFVAKSQ